MGVGKCSFSNGDKENGLKVLQRRIDGKSWGEIKTEFGISSAQARAAFKKAGKITDYKAKGKALKGLLDQSVLDDLASAGTSTAQAAVKAIDNVLKSNPTLSLEIMEPEYLKGVMDICRAPAP